jgi:acyl-coenzyme A thioesterase PaaI-like protein
MKDDFEIPDVYTIPDSIDNLEPEQRENWQAKRQVSAKIKDLIELLVTSDADIEVLDNISNSLDSAVAALENSPRYFGKVDYLENGPYQSFSDVSHELSPLSGLSNPLSPPVKIEVKDGKASGSVFCGWAYEGPPGTVHGGFVAAIFDQFLGMAQMIGKQPGMTGRLIVHYHARSPLNKELQLKAWLERVDGRKTIIHGEMFDGDNKTASCEGLFIAPKDGVHMLRPLE